MTSAALGLAVAISLAGCAPRAKRLDELKIQLFETGAVPVSTVPGLPQAEDTVMFTRGDAGLATAAFRHTVPCPSRMINSGSGIKVLKDRILLCFQPIEATTPEAAPLSSCPYQLAVRYEMAGIPASVEPKFEVVGSCTGF